MKFRDKDKIHWFQANSLLMSLGAVLDEESHDKLYEYVQETRTESRDDEAWKLVEKVIQFVVEEIRALTEQAYREYKAEIGLLNYTFEDLSEIEQEAWMSAVDRVVELVLHNNKQFGEYK